jgi:hypothetical protein
VLLTAQRVVAAGAHAINVYQFLHHCAWEGQTPPEFLPDQNPGELYAEWVAIPGGGHPVVSFLDFVAPDTTPPIELHQHLVSLKHWLSSPAQLGPAQLGVPWGRCWVRFATTTRIPLQTEIGALAGMILLRLTGH